MTLQREEIALPNEAQRQAIVEVLRAWRHNPQCSNGDLADSIYAALERVSRKAFAAKYPRNKCKYVINSSGPEGGRCNEPCEVGLIVCEKHRKQTMRDSGVEG